MEKDVPYEALLIDGRRVPSANGQPAPILNPATGETIAYGSQADPEDRNAAGPAARRSFDAGAWRRAGASERAQALRRLAALMREQAEELAQLETRNVGKPISDSRGEVPYAAGCFDYYAGIVPAFCGQ